MLDIKVSDPENVRDPVNEAITIVVGQHKVRTIIVARALPQGARAFRIGMTVAELLQEAVAEGVERL